MKEFSLPLRVYIEDTDVGGIVYYVNYLKFMERARTEFMRELGYHTPAFIDENSMLVVYSAQVNYRRPARLDDTLLATASIASLARSYIIFAQRVIRQGEVLCEGEIKVACVSRNAMKPRALPIDIREALQKTTK